MLRNSFITYTAGGAGISISVGALLVAAPGGIGTGISRTTFLRYAASTFNASIFFFSLFIMPTISFIAALTVIFGLFLAIACFLTRAIII